MIIPIYFKAISLIQIAPHLSSSCHMLSVFFLFFFVFFYGIRGRHIVLGGVRCGQGLSGFFRKCQTSNDFIWRPLTPRDQSQLNKTASGKGEKSLKFLEVYMQIFPSWTAIWKFWGRSTFPTVKCLLVSLQRNRVSWFTEFTWTPHPCRAGTQRGIWDR